jgi:hypothetical protein
MRNATSRPHARRPVRGYMQVSDIAMLACTSIQGDGTPKDPTLGLTSRSARQRKDQGMSTSHTPLVRMAFPSPVYSKKTRENVYRLLGRRRPIRAPGNGPYSLLPESHFLESCRSWKRRAAILGTIEPFCVLLSRNDVCNARPTARQSGSQCVVDFQPRAAPSESAGGTRKV